MPDWIIVGEDKCWFVEYFGLYNEYSCNEKLEKYKEKTHNKLEKYEKLHMYGKLYIYPEDLKNNFEGLMEKIKIIK